MSKSRVPSCVNEVQPNYKLPDLKGFIEYVDFTPIAPIDEFKRGLREIIKLGVQNFFIDNKAIASTLLLSLVSLTENYFRNILSRAILICPHAQKVSSSQNVNLGTVLWYGSEKAIQGVSENFSFASSSEIKNVSQKLLGFQVQKNSLLESVLEEYDKVCNLRHAVVHSDGFLAGKNATSLSIVKVDKRVRVFFDYASFQEVSAMCLTLVTNYNDELFKEFCERWAIIWRRDYNINLSNEGEKFQEVWKLFFSMADYNESAIKDKMDMVDCMKSIKTIYQL
ncbi:hypothetical protein [Ectobacillus ponti]|uniref:RiboL-PSP-HEPN domain-containing protein n=1 Tax=Ectobacillus ponti TaxID=2961894 RepID=A0AA41XE97_9BACI|nr:hypothetical protein [Ectobacillus ponti]MCP8971340.1 hypothetical protein [Ectobacillus ponti]